MEHSIYLADDEKSIRELLHSFLTSDGYTVRSFENGDALLEAFRQEPAELVILDIMMPGTDGLTVCRELRTLSDIPIILLTAKDSELDYVMGISQGSDDYLTKPFHFQELEARIRMLLRRSFTQADAALMWGGLCLDTNARTASCNGIPLELTMREFAILEYLMMHMGRPVSAEELMEHVWDSEADPFSNQVKVYISVIRRKLLAVTKDDIIRNIRGAGYLIGGEERKC